MKNEELKMKNLRDGIWMANQSAGGTLSSVNLGLQPGAKKDNRLIVPEGRLVDVVQFIRRPSDPRLKPRVNNNNVPPALGDGTLWATPISGGDA